MKQTVSRRHFLKQAALGAQGMVAAGAVSGCRAGSVAAESQTAVFTPGTYTAQAQGIGSVTATVTFDETSITNIELDLSGETPDIGGAAKDQLIFQIMEAQGVQIDGVSGATVTTKAVQKAVSDCIAKANGTYVEPTVSETKAEDWLGEEPETPASFAEELSADVVVLGSGYAGIAATRMAAESGASVVMLEKSGGAGKLGKGKRPCCELMAVGGACRPGELGHGRKQQHIR